MELFEEVNKELGTKYKSDEEIDWQDLSLKENFLSESFMEKWKDYIDWNNISMYQTLSESFIEKFQDRVNWIYISTFQKLSESFIEEYQNKVIWRNISRNQILSESFIEKWKDRVEWRMISGYQKLSESFIEKYQDKVDWNIISLFQKLSKKFIEKWRDKLNLKGIDRNFLIQSDIGRDWFVAYIDKNRHYYLFSGFLNKRKHSVRAKIYYKDLISVDICEKVEIIRIVNQYKICGKKDEKYL